MKQLEQRPQGLSLATACQVLGLNRSTLYARRRPPRQNVEKAAPPARQPRALDEAECQHVMETLHSEEFHDQPPAEVYSRDSEFQ